MQRVKERIGPLKTRAAALFREVKTDLKRDDVPGLGAEIAYHAIFAIPPLIILVVTIAAAINQFTGYEVASRLIEAIQENAPDEIRELLITLVNNAIANVDGGLVSVGVFTAALIAIWSGSNGVATMIKAFNRAYGVTEERGWLTLKTISVGMTILVAVLVNAAFLLLVFGHDLAKWTADLLNLGNTLTTIIEFFRWPLSVLFVILVLGLLYYVGPAVEQSFRWISPGSVIATLFWVVAVFGFKLYLHFSNPGSAYGALGSIVVLMFFLFVSGVIFVLGAEVNAILGTRYDPETVRDLAQNPERLEDPAERPAAVRRGRRLHRHERHRVRNQCGGNTDGASSAETSPADPRARAGRIIAIGAMAAVAIVGVLRRKGAEG